MNKLFGFNFEPTEYSVNGSRNRIDTGSHVTDHTSAKDNYYDIKEIVATEFNEYTIGWIASIVDPNDQNNTITVRATPIFQNSKSQVYWLGYNDAYGYVVVPGASLTYLGLAYISITPEEAE